MKGFRPGRHGFQFPNTAANSHKEKLFKIKRPKFSFKSEEIKVDQRILIGKPGGDLRFL